MNIFKTFDILLSEPLSMIHKRVIQILHVETNIFANKRPLTVESEKNMTQITVYNNQKMYNLLSTVIYKKKMKDSNSVDNIALPMNNAADSKYTLSLTVNNKKAEKTW